MGSKNSKGKEKKKPDETIAIEKPAENNSKKPDEPIANEKPEENHSKPPNIQKTIEGYYISLAKEMKMNQPQTWDGDMFAEFLHKTKLGCVALKFKQNYDFDWKVFKNEKPETFDKYTNDPNLTAELLIIRKDLIDYYQSLVEKGITMLKRKNNPKKQNI